jgi:hypothetical protein
VFDFQKSHIGYITERSYPMVRRSIVFLAVGMVVFFYAGVASADVPHMISYQGKLTTASGGCVNDTVEMTFSIYPDTLGSPADWSETQMQVVVQEGIFNVLLGAVDTIPQAVFDGSVKYLGVQVDADPEMRPLKPMVSVAYAYRAAAVDASGGGGGWVDDGAVVRLEDSTDQVGIGTSNPAWGCKLYLKDDDHAWLYLDPSGDTTWMIGATAPTQTLQILQGDQYGSTVCARLYGRTGDFCVGQTGGKMGVGAAPPREKLDVAEGSGAALAITNLSTSIEAGETLGEIKFYGQDGDDQVGAEIRSSAVEEWMPGSSGGDLRFLTTPAGSSTPVERVIVSDDGDVGVGTTTPNGKLHVETHGLYSGYFTSDYVSNQTHVIHAEYTGTAPGVAVYGESTPSDGFGQGGYFLGGYNGLLGKVEPTGSGTYYGVIGSVSNLGGSSGSNHGVHALADAGGTNYAVYALAYGDGTEMTYGTYSYANNSSTGDCYGGYFEADDEGDGTDSHVGLRANGYTTANQTVYGVQGYAENTGSGTVRGGYFQANSAGTGTHYGLVGNETAGGGGAAVYAAGDMIASGAKPCVVKLSKGHRLLYAQESPEIWFEDFGEGRLENGKAHIELDPLFLETVTINADHPMKVFVQLKDDCKGTFVKTGETGFDVHELQGGTSNASFSYRIVAKRKGYENERMRETDVGYDDPTLYPELQAEMDKAFQQERQLQQAQREKRRQEDERMKEEQRQMEEKSLR